MSSHFHWSYTEVMNMEHRERQGWVKELMALLQESQTSNPPW